MVKNVKPGLDLIPAGTIPPNPSELLGSERMEMLLEELQGQYDYVFLDMPPLCVVADALVVAPKTAGVVLVARYRSTTYEEMGEAVESVRNANIPMLGVVLSSVQLEPTGYGKYGSRYYGRYGRYERNRYYRTYDYSYSTKEKGNG